VWRAGPATGVFFGMTDLRPILFAGAEWYEQLEEPKEDVPSAWYVAKADRWTTKLLNVAASFAQKHNLVDHYRKQFAGIRAIDLTLPRADAGRQMVSFPIWKIAHELIAGCYLERVLGWRYSAHEPIGYKQRRGDWEFITKSGRHVFVEVKSVAEVERYGTSGVYNVAPPLPQLRNIVKAAYGQLPDDDRATLLILAGRETVESGAGIMLSGPFQTLFGNYVIRFNPFDADPEYKAGPSFRDMLIHGTKHRRLGCVAGMSISGWDIPRIDWYSIDNPYARPQYRIASSDLVDAKRFTVNEEWQGQEIEGLSIEEAWARMDPQS
jgi:hypothetical protein